MQRFWRLVLASLLALAGGVALAAPASAEVTIAISVYCTGELPGPAHKTKWLTPALPAPPVISLSMAASQVYGHPPRWR